MKLDQEVKIKLHLISNTCKNAEGPGTNLLYTTEETPTWVSNENILRMTKKDFLFQKGLFYAGNIPQKGKSEKYNQSVTIIILREIMVEGINREIFVKETPEEINDLITEARVSLFKVK